MGLQQSVCAHWTARLADGWASRLSGLDALSGAPAVTTSAVPAVTYAELSSGAAGKPRVEAAAAALENRPPPRTDRALTPPQPRSLSGDRSVASLERHTRPGGVHAFVQLWSALSVEDESDNERVRDGSEGFSRGEILMGQEDGKEPSRLATVMASLLVVLTGI